MARFFVPVAVLALCFAVPAIAQLIKISESSTPESFPPTYNSSSPFMRFAVIGDWGRQQSLQSIGMPDCSTKNFTSADNELFGGSQQRSVSKLLDEVCGWIGGCQYVISTGDNFYQCGVYPNDVARFQVEWRNVYKNPITSPYTAGLKWYNTFGNHDIVIPGSVEWQIAYGGIDSDWVFPDTNYVRDWTIGGVTVRGIFVDTNPFITKYNKAAYKYNSVYYSSHHNAVYVNKTIAFVEAALQKTPKPKYTMITTHYPLFGGAVQYGVPGAGVYPGEFNGWQMLNDLVNKYKVTAYFNGHDHTLNLVTGANTYQNATNSHTMYVTSGAGSIQGISDTCGSAGSQLSYCNGGNGGFVVVTADTTKFQVDYFTLGSISSQCTVTSNGDGVTAPAIGQNCVDNMTPPFACCATVTC